MLRGEHREGHEGHRMGASQEDIRTFDFIKCYRKSGKGGLSSHENNKTLI